MRRLPTGCGEWVSNPSTHPATHTSFLVGSGKRVGIARALVMEPEFIVCDEPISALDVSVQAQIVRLLGELKSSLGLTMLFIAHDLSMVRYVSDRMAVMYLGSIVELGSADDVFFRPKHPYTEILVGSNPQPDPRIERNAWSGCDCRRDSFAGQRRRRLPVRQSLSKGFRCLPEGDSGIAAHEG